MARKIQFDVSDDADESLSGLATPQRSEPASKAPSLSGMARSLQAAAAASIRDIDLNLIDDSQFKDRIPDNDDSIMELAESIRSQGQLIPILISPVANGRYRIVYGRRRLAALRLLNLPAKALIRELDEDQAIIAQGQENSYRKDLSWIEKAVFARQLADVGKSDDLICDTLNIDQKARRNGDKLTGLSRMKQVAAKLSSDLIDAVGPAPKVGRDRWYGIAQLLEKRGFPAGNQQSITDQILSAATTGADSDERFTALETAVKNLLKQPQALKAPLSTAQTSSDLPGTVKTNRHNATITIRKLDAKDLHKWISENPDDALRALRDAHNASTHHQ